MGVKGSYRSLNNAKISGEESFDKNVVDLLYNSKLPDFSDKEILTREDQIIEHAYTLASLENRSYISEDDLLAASLALPKDEVKNKKFMDILIALEEKPQYMMNIKVVKNSPTNKRAPQVITTMNKENPSKTKNNTKKPPINKNNYSIENTLRQELDRFTGGSTESILNTATNYGELTPRQIFLGHNTDGGSDKYYFMVERNDGTTYSTWSRNGRVGQSKIYRPGEKSFNTLYSEKSRKGYKLIYSK